MGLFIFFILNQDMIKGGKKPVIKNRKPIFLGAVVFRLKI